VHLYTVRDGKIVESAESTNSSDVVEAFLPADRQRGKALYTTCAGCHGNAAKGRPEMHAPNLTGLGARYITLQLRNFRDTLRGGTADTYGFMMNGRANSLPGDRGVRDVAAYIESLPTTRPASAPAGDAARGRVLYQGCASCHGLKAEGNENLQAPPLLQLNDYYMIAQIENFAKGVRGKSPADALGRQMQAPAAALGGEAAIRDVIAYLHGL
jgi:cytochrome c553